MPARSNITHRKTSDGHTLTPEQANFIDYFLETGNQTEAYKRAYVYKNKKPDKNGNYKLTPAEESKIKNATQNAQHVFVQHYVNDEIKRRRDEIWKANAATSAEVMEFFAATMRGEIKDQFGLEATLSDRLKAANELARRTVDVDQRMEGKADQVVEIKVDWKR